MSSRISNSIKNSYLGVLSQFIVMLSTFIVRRIFLQNLDLSYLGINGIFSNFLSILSLSELGFGTVMIFLFYKNLAQNNPNEISKNLNYFSRIYRLIGLSIFAIGLILYPLLIQSIKERDSIVNLFSIYCLYLANSVVSYFGAPKKTLLIADQKNYVISLFRLFFTILKSIFQIIILVKYQDFILYLILQFSITFIENFLIIIKVNRDYKFISLYPKEKLTFSERNLINKSIRSVFIYRVGSVLVDNTDFILISIFLGISTVGVISNYFLVISTLSLLLGQVSNAYNSSVGNFVSSESKDKYLEKFNIIVFINFIMFAFTSAGVFIFINPFISIWIGEEYVIDNLIVFFLSLNLLISGIMNPIWAFRVSFGLFKSGHLRPIITALLNLTFSVIFFYIFGLFGIILATTVSKLISEFWFDPLVLFKKGLFISSKNYFKKLLGYFCFYFLFILLIKYFFNLFFFQSLFTLIIGVTVFSILFFITITLIYLNEFEFKYFLNILTKRINSAKSVLK